MVVDPSNPEALCAEKLSEMINLSFQKSKNQKMVIKLLVNNHDKASAEQIERIEKWAQEYQVPVVKLENPLNGHQI